MKLSDLYAEYRAASRRSRAPSTERGYRAAMQQLSRAIGRTPTIEDLTDENLVALEHLLEGRSAFTINERTGRIKTLWRFANRRGLVTTYPTLDRLPTEDPVRRAWSVEQVRQLFDSAGRQLGRYDGVPAGLWWQTYIRFLWDTGERAGAAAAIRFDWLEGDIIAIPARARKAHKPAVYRLTGGTLAALESIRRPERPLVFPWPFCEATRYNVFRRILRRAGLPATRKDLSQRLRRTHLTYWAIGGGDPAARAQHSSRALTEKFYLDETKLEAIDPKTYLPVL